MSNTHRTVVVLGDLEPAPMSAAREAAAAVGALLVHHTGDAGSSLDGDDPLAVLVPMEEGGRAFELCADVRNNPRFANVPLVAIGAPRNSLSFGELFNSGGDDIVQPGDAATLARRLRAFRARAEPKAREHAMPGVDGHTVVAGPTSKWQMIVARALSNAGVATRFVTSAAEAIAASRGARAVVAAEDLQPSGAEVALAEARAAGWETPWVIVAEPRRVAKIAEAVQAFQRVAVVDSFAPPENALFVANELAAGSASESRAATRLLYGTAVSFRGAGREEEDDVGFTYNVSANGVFVRTLAPLDPGEEVWLELWAPRSSRRVRLAGKVAWRRHFGPNESATVPPGFGVQITDGLASDLERWRDGCALLERDEVRVRPSRVAPGTRATFIPSMIARATL